MLHDEYACGTLRKLMMHKPLISAFVLPTKSNYSYGRRERLYLNLIKDFCSLINSILTQNWQFFNYIICQLVSKKMILVIIIPNLRLLLSLSWRNASPLDSEASSLLRTRGIFNNLVNLEHIKDLHNFFVWINALSVNVKEQRHKKPMYYKWLS